MTCSAPGCKKKEFRDGFCSAHIPKAATAGAKVYTLCLARKESERNVNHGFAQLAAKSTPAEPYKQRIEHLRSSGPPGLGAEEYVHEIWCKHDTQKANNVTVWYSWGGDTMTVWGLGSHVGGSGAGNDKYGMLWYDGTSKNWQR
jgi:hypothetical protein